jgi:hypothetical protein
MPARLRAQNNFDRAKTSMKSGFLCSVEFVLRMAGRSSGSDCGTPATVENGAVDSKQHSKKNFRPPQKWLLGTGIHVKLAAHGQVIRPTPRRRFGSKVANQLAKAIVAASFGRLWHCKSSSSSATVRLLLNATIAEHLRTGQALHDLREHIVNVRALSVERANTNCANPSSIVDGHTPLLQRYIAGERSREWCASVKFRACS